MSANQLSRFYQIHKSLKRGGAVSTTVLASLCGVSLRTLKDDLAEMRLQYDAPIFYDRYQKGYVYTEPFELKSVDVSLTDREIVALRTAVATLSQFRDVQVFGSFKAVVDKIEQALRIRNVHSVDEQSYLAFESAPVGLGTSLIEPLLEACMQRRPVQFSHRKYTQASAQQRKVFPYVVKEHRNRWYVVGFDEQREEIRVFGLDRIDVDSLQLLADDHPLVHKAPHFDTGTYFRQALGVAIYDDPAQEVVLLFRSPENHQFKAQPFFPYAPTDVLLETADELRVKLTIILNDELVYELARLGPKVQVLAPLSLQRKLVDYLSRAIQQYTSL